MCICGGVLEIMVVTAVVTACSKGCKKEEKLTSLKLSSNERCQSSSKVPGWVAPEKGKEKAFLLLCPYCEDGTLDKECGDCHNVYAETGRPDRCSEPDLDSCYDCEWGDTPYAGRKLREGEKGWKEIQAEKLEAQILEKVGEETIKDYPCNYDHQEPKCMHEDTHNEYNSYGKLQERCDCGQWLGGAKIHQIHRGMDLSGVEKEEMEKYISPYSPVQDDHIPRDETVSEGLPVFPNDTDVIHPQPGETLVPDKAFEFQPPDKGPGYYSFDSEPKFDETWGPGEGKDPTPKECRANDLSCDDCNLPGSDEIKRPCRWEGPYRQNREDVK